MKERISALGRRLTYRESTVTVTAGRHVYLENCRRILEYNDIRICVQMSDAQLQIWGRNLCADSCSPDDLIIYGEIQSIEWIQKGADVREPGAGESL